MIREFFAKSSIRKLELRSGDIVLVRLRGERSPDELNTYRQFFADRVPEGVSVILMDDTTTVEVLRPAQ